MIRLALRFAPARGPWTLAWLAGATGALAELYGFLLRCELAAQLGVTGEDARDDRVAAIVAGRLADIGSPVVQVRDPAVLELGAPVVAGGAAVRALTLLAALVESGPHGADWPAPVRVAWHGPDPEADAARRAYALLRDSSVLGLVDVPLPPCAEPAPAASRKRKTVPSDLPTGVRKAASLER